MYGHEDHFGVKAVQLIENKMTMHRGAAHPDLKLSEEAQRGTCPVGGLAIPRGKVATVIGAMQDVELHELHGVVHMGRTPLHDTVHGGERCPPTGVSKQARKRARIAAAGGRHAFCVVGAGGGTMTTRKGLTTQRVWASRTGCPSTTSSPSCTGTEY